MTNRTVVHGAIVEGASAVPIDIAIEFKPGIPGIHILGIQDNAAVELRGIVRCALKAQGYTLPRDSGSIDVMPSPGYSKAFSGNQRRRLPRATHSTWYPERLGAGRSYVYHG